jgi:hypothetical protein
MPIALSSTFSAELTGFKPGADAVIPWLETVKTGY